MSVILTPEELKARKRRNVWIALSANVPAFGIPVSAQSPMA